jgi:hypothetical protein
VAWDNGDAHNRIVAKATKDDGSLDQAFMKSVHFWNDESAADLIASYKFLFCDVIDSEIKAVPRGIFACTGGHGLAVADIPEGDVEGVKAKIATYYKRMAKEFDDDSIKPSWEDDNKARRTMGLQERKDFNDLYQAAQAADCLEDWGDLVDTLTAAMMQLFCMGDQPAQDMAACLGQFGTAVMDWVDKGRQCGLAAYLNSRGYGGDNTPYVPYSLRVGDSYGYMARRDRPQGKIGARISGATQSTLEEHQGTMQKALNACLDHMKTMQESVDNLGGLWGDDQGTQNNKEPGDDDNSEGNGKSVRRREFFAPQGQPQKSITAKDITIDDLAALLI